MKNIAYLAGLFDGEGSFSIQVGLRSYKEGWSMYANPSMSVNLYYGSEVLDHFVERFGGQIYPYQKNGQGCGRRWHLGKKAELVGVAGSLLPHLEIKRDIARRFIEALHLFPENGKGANRMAGERNWTPERSVAVAEIALSLNPPRSRRSNKTAEYVEILRSQLHQAAHST